MDSILNFIRFSKYEWATQCLEMSKTTGYRWREYRHDALAEYIKNGEFRNALQHCVSVGSWSASVQGHDYWEEIHNREFL